MPDVAVMVVVEPMQICVLSELILTVTGLRLVMDSPADEALHPLTDVTVTVNVPVVLPYMDCVVAPVLQR
jgi:hypothetical protein